MHFDLGMVYANTGRNEDAVRELRMAMEYDPANAEAHLQLAKAYQSIERIDEANAQLDRVKGLPASARPSLQEMIDSIENPAP